MCFSTASWGESMRKQRKHERSLRATHGGDEAKSPLCRHGFQRGSSKRLLPNSRGSKWRYFFLIAVRFSGSVRVWRSNCKIQYRACKTHSMIYTRWCPSSDSLITHALKHDSRSGTYVGRWCLGPVCPHTRARGFFVDGRDQWMLIFAFMVVDRHVAATMELLPQNFCRNRTAIYRTYFNFIEIFIKM